MQNKKVGAYYDVVYVCMYVCMLSLTSSVKDTPPLLNVAPPYDLLESLTSSVTTTTHATRWLDATKEHLKTMVLGTVNGVAEKEAVSAHLATSLLELSNQLSSAEFRELLMKDLQ